MIVRFTGNRLAALLAVWIFGLLVAALATGMQFQLWLLNQAVLGLSFWGAVCSIVFGIVGLVAFLWQLLTTPGA